jgi:hypothetical protein
MMPAILCLNVHGLLLKQKDKQLLVPSCFASTVHHTHDIKIQRMYFLLECNNKFRRRFNTRLTKGDRGGVDKVEMSLKRGVGSVCPMVGVEKKNSWWNSRGIPLVMKDLGDVVVVQVQRVVVA